MKLSCINFAIHCALKPEFNHKYKTINLHSATLLLLSFSKSILVHRGPDTEFQLAPSVLSESDDFFFFLLYFCDCVALSLPHALLPFAHNPWCWLAKIRHQLRVIGHIKGWRRAASPRLASRPGTCLSIPVAIDGTLLTSCSNSPSSSLISPR